MNAERRCDKCEWWAPEIDERFDKPLIGWCQRFPPAIAGDGETGIWPMVDSFEWCGEFKPKEKTDEP